MTSKQYRKEILTLRTGIYVFLAGVWELEIFQFFFHIYIYLMYKIYFLTKVSFCIFKTVSLFEVSGIIRLGLKEKGLFFIQQKSFRAFLKFKKCFFDSQRYPFGYFGTV